jgi:hypothetical protein
MNKPVITPPSTTNNDGKSKNGIFKNCGIASLKPIAPTVSSDPIIKTEKESK